MISFNLLLLLNLFKNVSNFSIFYSHCNRYLADLNNGTKWGRWTWRVSQEIQMFPNGLDYIITLRKVLGAISGY
jgi:hypothetical protein